MSLERHLLAATIAASALTAQASAQDALKDRISQAEQRVQVADQTLTQVKRDRAVAIYSLENHVYDSRDAKLAALKKAHHDRALIYTFQPGDYDLEMNYSPAVSELRAAEMRSQDEYDNARNELRGLYTEVASRVLRNPQWQPEKLEEHIQAQFQGEKIRLHVLLGYERGYFDEVKARAEVRGRIESLVSSEPNGNHVFMIVGGEHGIGGLAVSELQDLRREGKLSPKSIAVGVQSLQLAHEPGRLEKLTRGLDFNLLTDQGSFPFVDDLLIGLAEKTSRIDVTVFGGNSRVQHTVEVIGAQAWRFESLAAKLKSMRMVTGLLPKYDDELAEKKMPAADYLQSRTPLFRSTKIEDLRGDLIVAESYRRFASPLKFLASEESQALLAKMRSESHEKFEGLKQSLSEMREKAFESYSDLQRLAAKPANERNEVIIDVWRRYRAKINTLNYDSFKLSLADIQEVYSKLNGTVSAKLPQVKEELVERLDKLGAKLGIRVRVRCETIVK